MKIHAAPLRAGKDVFHVVPDQTMARLDRSTAALATPFAIGRESESPDAPSVERNGDAVEHVPTHRAWIPTLRRSKLAGINPNAAKFPLRFYRAVSK